MSRIGKLPVALPQGVKVEVSDTHFVVEGPKGKLEQPYNNVTINIEDGNAVIERTSDSKVARSCHGLYRQLLNNMVVGVSQGFSKTLLVNGVGYRAEVSGKILSLNLGLSTTVEYLIPEGITITCDGPTKVTVSGIDKQQVGQVAAEIRSLRVPEPYKGKGIKYENEYIRRKVGKSGVK